MSDMLNDPDLPEEIKHLIRMGDEAGFPRPPVHAFDDIVEGLCAVCQNFTAINLHTGRCGACEARAILTGQRD